jgi:hypothetical protein
MECIIPKSLIIYPDQSTTNSQLGKVVIINADFISVVHHSGHPRLTKQVLLISQGLGQFTISSSAGFCLRSN